MNRIYCGDCKAFLVKERTGFTVRLSENVFVRGDQYRCLGCGHVVYGDFGEPFEARKK